MNISGQPHEIGVVLSHDRFISVLKQVTIALVLAVEIDNIPREKFPHIVG